MKHRDNMVRIVPDVIKETMQDYGLTKVEIGQEMGRSRTYINTVLKSGYMSTADQKHFCMLFCVDPDKLLYHEPVPTPEALTPETIIKGYNLEIEITSPEKIRTVLTFNGAPLYDAIARIKGTKEVDLVKAISYAAHLIYKMAEQADLRKEGE